MIGSYSEAIPPRQTATDMLRHGCGPGISRPADTEQHGVRSVPAGIAEMYRRLAREYQEMADTYMAMAALHK